MKKIILLLLIIVGVVIFVNQLNQIIIASKIKRQLHRPYEREALVSVQENGFNPSSMSLKQGTILHIVNTGTKDYSPALLMLPFHKISVSHALKPGEEWVVRPMVLGSWKLSDGASHVGVITIGTNGSLPDYAIDEDSQIPTGMNSLDSALYKISFLFEQEFTHH